MKAINFLIRIVAFAGAVVSCIFLLALPVSDSPDIGTFLSGNETKLRSADCGRTDYVFKTGVIKAVPVSGAESYKFKFIRLADTLMEEYTSTNIDCNPYYVNIVDYGHDYSVLVQAKVSGVWSDYGDTCYFDMLDSIPAPQLMSSSCEATGLKLTGGIHSNAGIYVQDHHFLLIDTLNSNEYSYYKGGYNYTALLRYVKDSIDQHLRYNRTYEVYCRTKVRDTWSDFGEMCYISMDSIIPTTKLRVNYCENTSVPTNGFLLVNQVFAEDYQFVFTNHETNEIDTINRGSDSYILALSQTNLNPSECEGYSVRVRALNVDQWSEFGPSCNIWTTCNVPLTKLDSLSCNTDSLIFTDPLYCDTVANADSVRWQFIGPALINKINFFSDSFSVLPDTLVGLVPDSTYAVRVFAKVSGEWGVSRDTCWVSFIFPSDTAILNINTELINSGITIAIHTADSVILGTTGGIVSFPNSLMSGYLDLIPIQFIGGRTIESFFLKMNPSNRFDSLYTIYDRDTVLVSGELAHLNDTLILFHSGYFNLAQPAEDSLPIYPELYKRIAVHPDGDGAYDSLSFQINVPVQSYYLNVMNRSDSLVFATSDAQVKWDCKDVEGKLVPRGPYKYEVELNGDTLSNQFLINY